MLLHHTAVQIEAGEAFMEPMRQAAAGTLGEPYVVVYEGSIANEDKLASGYWSAIGEEVSASGERVQVPSAIWLRRLAMRPQWIARCRIWRSRRALRA